MSSSPSIQSDSNPVQPNASSKYAVLTLVCGLLATAWIYSDTLQWLVGKWRSSEDYSHGFLVPLVSIYVLYVHREKLAEAWQDGNDGKSLIIGVGILIFGLLFRLAGIYTSVLTVEGLSLVFFLLGLVVIVAGLGVGKWALPAIAYLVFMVPLPGFLGGQLSGVLQSIATTISTFALQTAGVPAVSEGNIIHLSNGTIGVAQACSGIRMLYSFFALTVAACLILDRSWFEKVVWIASAIPIAIAVNCVRIILTGMAYEYGDPEIAEKIFHDLAGWLMMPMGLIFLFGLLAFLRWAIIWDDETQHQLAT